MLDIVVAEKSDLSERLSSPAAAAGSEVRANNPPETLSLPSPSGLPAGGSEHRTRQVRSIFVSDLHIGTRECNADLFLDFLQSHDAEQIYLIGDILDGWHLNRGAKWPARADDIIQELAAKCRGGASILYVPGNHDEFLRRFCGLQLAGVRFADAAIHEAADGRRYFVVHGDHFDQSERYPRWLVLVGDCAYIALLRLSIYINAMRRLFGRDYWSLAAFVKGRLKGAAAYIHEFENALSREAARIGVDGVICGHIHHPAIRDLNEVTYMNSGDWVENCSAVIETHDGNFEVVTWHEEERGCP